MAPSVLIVATLDTKGAEAHFVRTKLAACGVATTLVDAGTLHPPHTTPDVTREQVLAHAGTSLDALRANGERAVAVRARVAAGVEVGNDHVARLGRGQAPIPSKVAHFTG